ncbi:MAG TPA: pitrilysin family protein [Actinomycetes bacterium]|nr:pitrilysin family protein [Actinomycetes bacterium]
MSGGSVARSSTRTLHRGQDGSVVKRTVLPTGLRIVSESIPTVRSVSFGLWVGVGSRDESVRQAGATHYLEHLLFKGTHQRSALDISSAIDCRGGEINAFTAKEFTCYYARVLDSDLPIAVDVVVDMVMSSTITGPDFEAERGVILEEIAMHDDDPGDVVHDAFAETIFGDTPLGRPILGSTDSIDALARDTVRRYYRRWYRPEHIVVAAAGNLDHAHVVKLVKKAFASAGHGDNVAGSPAPVRGEFRKSGFGGGVNVLRRSTEQVNLVLGVPGVRRTDERRFALGVLNSALGGGMSSRLFQEIREKRGLAYSVYSYNTQYSDAGLFGVYAGCLPKKVDDVLELCRVELQRVSERGISTTELVRGKGQMSGSLVLGMEDTGSRMTRIGKSELVYGEMFSVDEILARIDAVTLDEVQEVAAEVLGAPPTLAVIGPFDEGRNFSAAVA